MQTRYTKEAQNDIESAYAYLAVNAGIPIADRVIDAIVATCTDLATFPMLGRRRPELDSEGFEVRSIGERGYVIFYAEHKEQLFVLRVLHGAQDVNPGAFDSLET